MQMNECKAGMTVWARMGAYGWRPAVVVAPRHRYVTVQFLSGVGGRGSREPSALRQRDPRLDGKDKPTVEEARATALTTA
jgi:hypothetical protein